MSKPPYLTALALWPKGDCWHGGGLFEDDTTVVLNHKREVAKPHPNHLLPRGMRVRLKNGVCGEDDPLFSERLQRDGWKLEQEWVVENRGYPKLFLTRKPEIREKTNPDGSLAIRLTRSIETLDYAEEFAVSKRGQSTMTELDRASWADWDQQGRLVFARDGKILAGHFDGDGQLVERELIDLNPSKHVALSAPDWASMW